MKRRQNLSYIKATSLDSFRSQLREAMDHGFMPADVHSRDTKDRPLEMLLVKNDRNR